MKRKILIVDDEIDMCFFLKTLFETSGYTPLVTRNGTEGLAVAKAEIPDLIVLDVMMPGEGGAHMYRELKSDETFSAIPVIMLSAVEQKAFYHYLKMLNIQVDTSIPNPDLYMEKPPDPDELLKAVQNLTDL